MALKGGVSKGKEPPRGRQPAKGSYGPAMGEDDPNRLHLWRNVSPHGKYVGLLSFFGGFTAGMSGLDLTVTTLLGGSGGALYSLLLQPARQYVFPNSGYLEKNVNQNYGKAVAESLPGSATTGTGGAFVGWYAGHILHHLLNMKF